MKTFNEYQEFAVSTAIYPEALKVIYPTIGLAGECGEVSEKVKKSIRDHNGLFKPKEIAMELGDVLWYVANIANDLGLTLEDIVFLNETKLVERIQNNTLQGEGDNR